MVTLPTFDIARYRSVPGIGSTAQINDLVFCTPAHNRAPIYFHQCSAGNAGYDLSIFNRSCEVGPQGNPVSPSLRL